MRHSTAVRLSTRAPHPPCCMIVEDQVLIGLALEADLEDLGYAVAGPLVSSAAAMAWLESKTPDLAILDYMLEDGACGELAQALRQAGVPFLVYSGYSREPETPAAFQDVPWVEKPAARTQLISAMAKLPVRSPCQSHARAADAA